MKEETRKAVPIITGVLLLFTIPFMLPTIAWALTGEFTYHIISAMEEKEDRIAFEADREDYNRVKEHCEFNVVGTQHGYECHRPCLKHSLDDKNCVEKGCVDSGFLGLGYDCGWYVCEGFGDIKSQCLQHYYGSKEDYCKENPDHSWWCKEW